MNEPLQDLLINHDGFVFNPSTGDSFMVNSTALVVLQELQDGVSVADVASSLVSQFDVVESDARRDVDDMVDRMKSMSLL